MTGVARGRLRRLLCAALLFVPLAHAGDLVIVIDDLGNNLAAGQRAIDLPGPVTYAILPHSPYGPRLARQAHRSGKEVILHMPMSNLGRRRLGEGALRPTMTREQFRDTLHRAIASVPHLSGINNHMGSELTQLPIAMRWLMEDLRCYRLYFLDSRTTSASVALDLALHHDIDALGRDVFLDNSRRYDDIAATFAHAINLLARSERIVLIGHPYPETLAFLERALPQLAAQGIVPVPASAALERRPSDPLMLALDEDKIDLNGGR
jgi:hypothetical protein